MRKLNKAGTNACECKYKQRDAVIGKPFLSSSTLEARLNPV